MSRSRARHANPLLAESVLEETDPDAATLYIPCPVCLAPIAVARPSEQLPRTFKCPTCSAVLVR